LVAATGPAIDTVMAQPLNPTIAKGVALVTSEWLCGSNETAVLSLARQIRATQIMIYFAADNWLNANWNWKMTQIDSYVNYFRQNGFVVWAAIQIETLNESKGIAQNVQSYVDRFKGRIIGIYFDFNSAVTEQNSRDIENWLIAKKAQLGNNDMSIMYYHGDGAATGAGPPTDVDPVYLSNQGIIVRAWLQDDGSWKPRTFQLREFWVNYPILNPSFHSGQSEGQTYSEIMNWYRNIVVAQDGLQMNPGAKFLLWEVHNQQDMPGPGQISAMREASILWMYHE
jgi:hypothetical protein